MKEVGWSLMISVPKNFETLINIGIGQLRVLRV